MNTDVPRLRRRGFLAGGAGVGTAILAGCAGASDGLLESSGDDAGSSGSTGQFRLLVSDQPSAIGDFAELKVTFEKARVFRGDGPAQSDDDGADDVADTAPEDDDPGDDHDDGDDAGDGNGDDDEGGVNGNGDDENGDDDEGDVNANGNGNGDDENGDDAADDSDDRGRGFVDIDLDGETADLTQLIGEKATQVADVPLETGSYSSIQMFVADVEGIASDDYDPDDGPGRGNQDDRQPGRPDDTSEEDGDEEDAETEEPDTEDEDAETEGSENDEEDGEIVLPVKLPSERLQIVRPFDVVEGEQIEFVFDINVIRRGDGEYILQPVISESGVVGEDVEADVIDDNENEGGEDDEEEEESEEDDVDPDEQESDNGEDEEDDDGENGD